MAVRRHLTATPHDPSIRMSEQRYPEAEEPEAEATEGRVEDGHGGVVAGGEEPEVPAAVVDVTGRSVPLAVPTTGRRRAIPATCWRRAVPVRRRATWRRTV